MRALHIKCGFVPGVEGGWSGFFTSFIHRYRDTKVGLIRQGSGTRVEA
jgi:hypothetical protein